MASRNGIHSALVKAKREKLGPRPPGVGGGGGLPYVCILGICAVRETSIFSPKIPFRSISFSQITKKSGPEHHDFRFLGGFCRSGDHHFQNFFNSNPFIASHGRLSPLCVRQRRGLAAGQSASQTRPDSSGYSHFHNPNRISPEPRIFMLKTAQALSEAPHFHAQNGSSSIRSPAFSRSTGSSFRSPGPFFTLPR